MVNEGDDKYEGAEESEYHFSDDEVSYEADPDANKPMPAATSTGGGLAGFASSRRMLISLGVFLGLVFVVYKMVAPSSTAPSTEIAPAKATPPAVMTSAAPAPATTTAMPATAPAPAPQAAPAMSPPPVMAVPAPAPTAMPASSPDMGNAMPAPQPASPAAAPSDAGVQQASMTAPPTSAMPDMSAPMNPAVSAAAATVSADSDRLAAQMQADYEQRLANYQAENKALQDQVQTLNARVASMETEMSQLIQTLTKQFQNTGSADGSDATTGQDANAPAAATPDIKLPYTVQAIIPGRAWLRSDNGDTLTVAEGDVIKDVGQVTKIDPYDGVVEIKVGNKTVSLSYGGSGG